MAITKEVLDELLKEYRGPEDITGPDGLLKQLIKALIEGAMEVELTEHVGYEKHDQGEKQTENRRNGRTKKTLRADQGPLEIAVSRDREGTFEPAIIPKHQREFKVFDDKILSMYARGMTTREISGHLKEIYGVEVSPELISRATDSVKELLDSWRNRSLEPLYSCRVCVRDDGKVAKKALYVALGINLEGKKELLGLWLDQAEGASFWLRVLNELKNRGVQDILIAAVDGLSGFPDAMRRGLPVYPRSHCLLVFFLVRWDLPEILQDRTFIGK